MIYAVNEDDTNVKNIVRTGNGLWTLSPINFDALETDWSARAD
jgi:hypothetical protein